MTSREKEILSLLESNPMISQKECSHLLNISRSAVAGHIMNLKEKGYIKGKGYIFNEEPYVLVIGGSNMDITGFPNGNFIKGDSNPGDILLSSGGVARNIAENIARLGTNVKLQSLVGDDLYGKKIIDDCQLAGIDTSHIKICNNDQTSTYLAILEKSGDMISAISSMSIMEKLDIHYIKSKSRILNSASLIILDANLSEETLRYIVEKYKNIPIFFDPVSVVKAKKILPLISTIHTIKPNKIEMELLSGMKINNQNDMKESSHKLLKKGVKRIFITLGSEGTFYCDSNSFLLHKNKSIKANNATGAGDSYTAALAYSFLKGFDIKKTLQYARAASLLTIMDKKTICKEMSVYAIEEMIRENKV